MLKPVLFDLSLSSWPFLAENQVHIWQVRSNISFSELAKLQLILSEEEQKRAAKYLREEPRRQFISSRAWLRIILGRYLNLSPQSLAFLTNPFGKPYPKKLAGKPQIQFNLAHSRDLTLLAFCVNHPLGIDLEFIQPDFDYPGIAHQIFSPAEKARLEKIPETTRPPYFYQLWTQKEAYLKATGTGLSISPNRLEVLGNKIRNTGSANFQEDWQVKRLFPGENYLGAVVVKVETADLYYWSIYSKEG